MGKDRQLSYINESNKYYDLSTGAYQLYFGEHFHFFPWANDESMEKAIDKFNDLIISDGKLNTQSFVLELGCGIGSLSLLIKKTYNCEITAVNINDHQLEIARQRAGKAYYDIKFINQDIMKLALNKKYDTIFLIDVEPHLPNKLAAIKNIKKHLRKGGRLVMTAWLQNEKPSLAQKEFLIKPYCKIAAFPYMESFNGYKRIFIQEKLKVIKFEDYTEENKKVINYFYLYALELLAKFTSQKSLISLVKNKAFLKAILKSTVKSELVKTADDVFLGPIYTKLCSDAGVFKFGYFVLEN